ncbi:hypothetical protein NDU88_000606 [Pleurodeles waltl]|uniref:Uncharacterized protein n=1 Tax=Pleurodeles waltl TaxID=8319 RepID=A0AAV7R4P5_PLEWA|nr:hypothetical protein NDU88_000606 [Pleurodeles waltl]
MGGGGLCSVLAGIPPGLYSPFVHTQHKTLTAPTGQTPPGSRLLLLDLGGSWRGLKMGGALLGPRRDPPQDYTVPLYTHSTRRSQLPPVRHLRAPAGSGGLQRWGTRPPPPQAGHRGRGPELASFRRPQKRKLCSCGMGPSGGSSSGGERPLAAAAGSARPNLAPTCARHEALLAGVGLAERAVGSARGQLGLLEGLCPRP